MQSTNIADAAYHRDWEKVRQLVERGDDVNVVGKQARATGLHWAALRENKAICELLLKSGANISATDKDGNQPLHMAACRNEAGVCELLVAHGADVTAVNKKGWTPLILAVGRPWLRKSSAVPCRRLITNDSVNVEDCGGNHALHFASLISNIVTVQLLVDCGADTNAVNKDAQTPLHAAACGEKDCPELCEILLKHDAEINAVDEDGNQPLHYSCQKAHTETVKWMLSHGADTNAVNKHGQTPLHTAAGGEKDCPELCEILLKHDAEINAVDEDGNQPLHFACQKAHTETVKWMMSLGMDANAVNKHGQTPLHTAAGGEKDYPELCEILLKHDAEINAVDEDGNQPLHFACQKAHTETVKWMMSLGMDANAVNKHGQTPLHTAAGGEKDYPELCEILLKHDAEINAVDEDGNQPLHFACQKAHTETVKWMVSHRADTNPVNKCGQTPLHAASGGKKDFPELCTVLLKYGAKTDPEDEDGNQPLHLACKQGHTEIVKWLVCHGADTNAVNKHGQTPLCIVVVRWKDSPKLVKILLRCGLQSNTVEEDGDQLLHLACKQADTEAARLMVCHGADTNAVNKHGRTPLHTAASREKGCPELCDILLKHDAKVNAVDQDGNQPLHLAIDTGLTSIVSSLLDCNADVSATNNDGQTSLHKAASGQTDCPDLCLLLIGKGAEVNAVDGNGETPLHVALKKGSIKAVYVLLENGADCNVLNGLGETVLHLVCKGGVDNHELCEDLLSHGASPHLADREGNMPWYIALKNGLPKTSWLLYKQFGSFTLDDFWKMNTRNGSALLCFAVNSCDTESCQKLLDIGVNPNAPNTIDLDLLPDLEFSDVASMHPLHIAVAKNSSELCHLLLDHGANVNVQMHTHCIASRFHLAQPLHLAVELDFINVCRLLIEHDALIDAETEKGKSPLHLAIVGNRNDIARLLLSYNAVLDSTLERSARRGTQSVAQLLRDSGE